MKYSVKYKKGLFWRRIDNVISDGYIENKDVRFFVLEDKRVIEINSNNVIFIFPPERMDLVDRGEVS